MPYVALRVRSDNGSEFVAKRPTKWFNALNILPLFIDSGSPRQNGYCEPFNGKMRYEPLYGELFYTLKEAKAIINTWAHPYSIVRPHSSLSKLHTLIKFNEIGVTFNHYIGDSDNENI
ncbi:integrase core domain-containing protein [bacterium]|nr:integrase core domain-containing protein [bacterium]